jgi:hypothetical protein
MVHLRKISQVKSGTHNLLQNLFQESIVIANDRL